MGTLQGIGTTYLGWRHRDDGASTATLWFTFVYLPVVPLRRVRLRNLTDFEAERSPSVLQVAAALGGGVSWTDSYEILERLRLSWKEVAGTYLRCYVLVPALCVWPILVASVVLRELGERGVRPSQGVLVAVALVCLANALVVLLRAVGRMRGRPSSSLARAARG